MRGAFVWARGARVSTKNTGFRPGQGVVTPEEITAFYESIAQPVTPEQVAEWVLSLSYHSLNMVCCVVC